MYSYLSFVYFFTLKCNKQYSNIIQFFTLFTKSIFPGQTPVPPRPGIWILDLSHDSIGAIWLAEVSNDGICNYIHSKTRDEITFFESMNNLIPHITGDVTTYPCGTNVNLCYWKGLQVTKNGACELECHFLGYGAGTLWDRFY